MDQPDSAAAPSAFRRDGWTPQRQLIFLDMLARTHSVTRAARATGMSRESAYRLRARDPHGLFAAAWDRVLQGPVLSSSKGHKPVTSAGARESKKRRNIGGFQAMWRKGHELHDTLFPPSPPPAL